MPAWGQAGEVVGRDDTTFVSSQPLTWTPGATHYVLLRRPDGSGSGPHEVEAVDGEPDQFTLADTLDFDPRADLSLGDRTSFTFGPTANYRQDVVVTTVSPQDEVTVELTAVPYDPRVHAVGA